MLMNGWLEVADGVLVRRYAELDLSVGLVLGAERALVIDTRGDHAQGEELARAVRKVTGLPWQVVITHAHFDHCFGTAAFLPAAVWAQERCAVRMAQTVAKQRAEWAEHYRRQGRHDIASTLEETEPAPPDHHIALEEVLDLGSRSVRLLHPGRGHTDHDLVVAVPDAGVVFAGDLVEHGAPPAFEDAFPAAWPSTMDTLLGLDPHTVVPGHGDPVGPEFVRTQRNELAVIAELCREYQRGTITDDVAVRRSPYPAEPTRIALRRPSDQ